MNQRCGNRHEVADSRFPATAMIPRQLGSVCTVASAADSTSKHIVFVSGAPTVKIGGIRNVQLTHATIDATSMMEVEETCAMVTIGNCVKIQAHKKAAHARVAE